jgi:spore maturation protein CgeB
VRELNFNNYNTKLIYENNVWKSIEILKREPGHNNGSDNNRFFISAMDGTEIGMYLAEDNNRKAVVFEPSDFAFFYASKKFDTKRIIRIVDFEEGIKIGMLKKTKTISDKNQDLEFYINTKKKPSICVIGPIYGGSLEIAEYAAEGFKQNGYETFYCDNSIFHKEMLHNAENPNMQSVILNKIMDLCYQRVLKTRADIIFALAQAPVSSFMIDEFKKKGILTAFWFVEDFRTLTYWKKIYRDYDIFFAIQDGAFINKINNTGGRAFYLPLAAPFPANTKTTGEIYRCEVSFVGAPYPNRINILTKIRSEDIAIFGEGWDAVAPQLKAIIGNRRVSRDEIRSIYANSKININLYSSLFDTGVEQHRDYINPRTFEIAACGGFQLSDYRKGIEDYFTPGEEIEVFMTVDELIEKIRYYKRNSGKAKQISLKAKEKVEKYHKYSDRMKIAVKIMETGRNYAKTL